MKKTGKPVQNFDQLTETIKSYMMPNNINQIDFSDTKIAFANKSDHELKKAEWLFKMMNKQWLVDIGAALGIRAIKLHLPFVETIVKSTIFEQFCGGTTLLESQKTIEKLYKHSVLTVLDYGVEAKETEEEFNRTMNENIRALEFAATNASTPIISSKVTGLARFGLLKTIQQSELPAFEEKEEYQNVLKRMDNICSRASKTGVGVFFDAEESWIQDTIDHLVNLMMKRYNKEKVVVYNTFQLYRTDRLQFLLDSYEKSRKEGYLLGAKLVRGAYMDKERERSERLGYPSPIHPNKKATDNAYNTAIRFCVDNYKTIASCNASHNLESVQLQANLISQKGLPKNHPHLNFCQLLGMSDHLTFNLANAGYNVAKYLVYGAVKDVVPYLVRRAQENSSVTGDMSRELNLITTEVKRRGLS